MKVLVVCDASGAIESIAVPDPDFPAQLHLEVEGGAVARELEVDEGKIRREDLLGLNGEEAEARALRQLQKLI